MFRVCRLFRVLSIPDSTAKAYYFDPLLLGCGTRKFDPNMTQGKVSQQEFEDFRQKLIQAGGSQLSFAKCLFLTMCVTFPIGFLLFLVKIILAISGHPMDTTEVIIYLAAILIPNIAIGCFWRCYSASSVQALQETVNQENRNYFSSRGVTFKTGPSPKYMIITFSNANNAVYSAPQMPAYGNQPVYENQPAYGGNYVPQQQMGGGYPQNYNNYQP